MAGVYMAATTVAGGFLPASTSQMAAVAAPLTIASPLTAGGSRSYRRLAGETSVVRAPVLQGVVISSSSGARETGCSRHVEACWRGNAFTSSKNHTLPWSTTFLIRSRRCYVGRNGSGSGTTTTTTGRGSAAAAVASLAGRKAKSREVVVPEPDYRIPIVLLGFAGLLVYQDNLLPAAPVGLLGLLLLFQTTRVRFVFDEEALEVKVGDQLQESGENVFVGGKNRWKYSTFANWELWWPNFPILVYFKEKQTKPEGQIHFFPVIFNGKQLYDVMVERAGPSKTSGPKQT